MIRDWSIFIVREGHYILGEGKYFLSAILGRTIVFLIVGEGSNFLPEHLQRVSQMIFINFETVVCLIS